MGGMGWEEWDGRNGMGQFTFGVAEV
jgi:hypothetical protein